MVDVFYYSGRGNSLAVAKELSSHMTDFRLHKIVGNMPQSAMEVIPGHALGLIFPVIDLGIPIAVRTFIRNLDPFSESPYAFAAVTTGGMPAGILAQTRKLLSGRGIRLVAAVLLPFSLAPGDAALRSARLSALCGAICSRSPLRYEKGSFMERVILTGAANFLARKVIPHEARKFVLSPSCDGCGICAKVCPASNISMVSRRPQWGRSCEQCAACFAWCPKEAISGTCLAAKTRYRNTEISMVDMLADRAKVGVK